MDCAFCTEFAALPGPGTRIICETSGWVLLPTVGCLTPGYCLFMPLDHMDAAADATPNELALADATAEEMRALISSVFGPVIIAEHGPRGCELGAGCCSHAHLHMIPVPDPGPRSRRGHCRLPGNRRTRPPPGRHGRPAGPVRRSLPVFVAEAW